MALYHKHRPQKFSDIVGQEHIVKTIENQVNLNKVAHAYLFSGPRGVGKTTTARLLAKAINCTNKKEKTSEPCNTCESCEEIAKSRAIDVIEIDAASHTGVDNVRENIIENAQFKPTKSKYKVFIIDEVHMLSTSAFNALLKTLEEPPAHVIFVLATTELHKLPETIISRCQRFNYQKVNYSDLKNYLQKISKLEKVKIEDSVLDRIINKSDGCVRDSISLLDQIMATGEKEITAEVASLVLPTSNVEETLEFTKNLIENDPKSGLKLINSLADSGINLLQFANDTIELLRIMMITKADMKATGAGIDLNDKVKTELENLNKKIDYNKLVKLIDLVMKRRLEIKTSPLPQLPLEMVLIEFCSNDVVNVIDDENVVVEKKIKKNIEKTEPTPKPVPPPEPQKKIKTEEPDVKKQPTTSDNKPANFTKKDLENSWNNFIKKLKELSPTLVFFVNMATLESVEGNTVRISLPYTFHKDKLEENENTRNIEIALSETMDCKVKLAVSVKENQEEQENKNNNDNPELQELATALGGEVL